jgi:hypothetical protein
VAEPPVSVDRNAVAVGDILEVVEDLTAYTVRNGFPRYLSAGDEVVVTSKNSRLNVRLVAKNSLPEVMGVSYGAVRVPFRRLGERPPEGLDPEDPRIAWIFEDASRLAERLGLCSDYDKVADQLGLPGRERDFKITFDSPGDGIKLTATVRARSKRQAEEKLRQSSPPQVKSVKAIGQ